MDPDDEHQLPYAYSWKGFYAELTDEEQLVCAYSWREQILYYIVHPMYFLRVVSENVLGWVWK